MKKFILIALCLMYSIFSYSQLSISKIEGASVTLKLGLGMKINDGSSLLREHITINDSTCSIKLSDVTIGVFPGWSFKQSGKMTIKEPIVAFEVIHILYNVFGEHTKTLSHTMISDIDGLKDLSNQISWYATENEVSEYFVSVSYVATVRNTEGKIWRYNFEAIKEQLNKLAIQFDKGQIPTNVIDK